MVKFFILLAFFVSSAMSQDLMKERIRKISSRKRSIYLERGIFHNGNVKTKTTLNSIRHSYSGKRKYERLVFDFSTQTMPRVYGHFSSEQKKIFLDFFDTKIGTNLRSLGKAKFVETLKFFPIDEESLSIEVELKKKASADIFYLEKPARLVIDIKE